MLSLEQLLLELVLEDSSVTRILLLLLLLLLFDLELKALKEPFAGPEVADEAEDDW